MNTIEDAKKVAWILGFLRAKLEAESSIRIKMYSPNFGANWEDAIDKSDPMVRLFDISDLPLLYAKISWLENDISIWLEIVIREYSIIMTVSESHEATSELPLNVPLRGFSSMETFRKKILPVIQNHILEYKSGEALDIFHGIKRLILEKTNK